MEYKFKQIKLSPAEKLWLTEILKLDFADVDVNFLKVKLRDKLPEDFDPKKIPYWLINDNHLTLIGLWHIDPQNVAFGHISKIVEIVQELILKNPRIREIKANEIAPLAGITERDAQVALKYLSDFGNFFGSWGSLGYGIDQASFPQNDHKYDKFLKFKNLEQEMEQYFVSRASPSRGKNTRKDRSVFQQNTAASFLQPVTQDTWDNIYDDLGISKLAFAKNINFVTDEHIRTIIFRDVEQAYILASHGFSKPALILAGGVIEELLRLYLEHKNINPKSNRFVDYIKVCEENDLLKRGVSRLSDSIRDFRNLVHLAEERTKKHSISKATAKGAVASIFTIANDF